MSCHKAIVVLNGRAHCFHDSIYITLVPDKWSRMYCLEYFNVFEYLLSLSHEIKKVGGIIAKPAPKKKKNYHH